MSHCKKKKVLSWVITSSSSIYMGQIYNNIKVNFLQSKSKQTSQNKEKFTYNND